MGVNKNSQTMLIVEPSEEEESVEDKGSVLTFLASRIHESFTVAADRLSAIGFLTTEERIAISSCIGDALEVFSKVMKEKVPTAADIEVPIEVAQEILRNAISHRRQGIVRLAQDEDLGAPISSEYLDLPDRTQDHKTLRELIELALMDERSAVNSYDNLLDVVYQMDLVLEKDLPTRKAFEEIIDDERDHEKILLRMLGSIEAVKIVYDDGKDSTVEESTGRWVYKTDDNRWLYQDNGEPVPDPVYRKAAGRRSHDKCMRCKKPPEYEMMWADGRAHAWFCESHLKEFISEEHDRKNGSDIPWIKEVIEGEALKNPTENTNPDVKSKFTKKATAQETSDKFVEELSKLEHDQWVGWTKDIAKEEDISEERLERWEKEWIPYEKLPEDVKEFDREYAKKVLDVVEKELPTEISNIVLPATEAAFFEELVRISREEPFRFDPNSTENEGRWRLMDPKVFVQGSVRRWNIWKEMKAPGIQFVMGQDTRDKQWKPQAIRFKKPDWDERKAAAWWEQNKGQFQREWTQTDWDEWTQKHPDEVALDYTGKTSQEAMKTGQIDMPRTLAIDLDGTILEYDGFKGVGIFGNPIDGAREALQKFKEDGWFIVIDTCRGEVPQVIEHLTLFDIPFDSVNDHPFQPSTANPGKPMAEYRIDDTAIHFDGDWASVHDEISRRERVRSLRGVKVAWKPPIEKKIALQELAGDLSDGEWLGVLVHTAGATGDSVTLSRKVGMDTYRMVLCGSEYRAFRNFDPIYRSGGLFNKQELHESFEAAISSTDPATVDSILRELESCLLSGYRGHGFNNPEQWISITGTDINGDHRIIYVEADPRGFARYNEPPVADPQSLLVFLKRIADGAFAYDPKKYILFDFLDPFGNRAQPTDYPDPALWGDPKELKKQVRKRRQRDKGELAEELDRMKDEKLLNILVKETLQ